MVQASGPMLKVRAEKGCLLKGRLRWEPDLSTSARVLSAKLWRPGAHDAMEPVATVSFEAVGVEFE